MGLFGLDTIYLKLTVQKERALSTKVPFPRQTPGIFQTESQERVSQETSTQNLEFLAMCSYLILPNNSSSGSGSEEASRRGALGEKVTGEEPHSPAAAHSGQRSTYPGSNSSPLTLSGNGVQCPRCLPHLAPVSSGIFLPYRQQLSCSLSHSSVP